MDHYYHGSIDSKTASRRLLRGASTASPTGRYLVRRLPNSQYCLSYVKDGKVVHARVPTNRNHNIFSTNENLLNSPLDEICNFMIEHFDYKLLHPVSPDEEGDDESDGDDDEPEPAIRSNELRSCHICDKHVTNLSIHMRLHTITFCEECETIISTKSFDGHKATCHPDKMHQCLHCDFKTPYSHALKGHVSTQHQGGGGTYSCDKCVKIFSSIQRLDNHVAQDHNNGKFLCSQCPKSYSHRRSLTHHMKSHDGAATSSTSTSPPSTSSSRSRSPSSPASTTATSTPEESSGLIFSGTTGVLLTPPRGVLPAEIRGGTRRPPSPKSPRQPPTVPVLPQFALIATFLSHMVTSFWGSGDGHVTIPSPDITPSSPATPSPGVIPPSGGMASPAVTSPQAVTPPRAATPPPGVTPPPAATPPPAGTPPPAATQCADCAGGRQHEQDSGGQPASPRPARGIARCCSGPGSGCGLQPREPASQSGGQRHRKQSYSCEQCTFVTSSKVKLRKHRKIHRRRRQWKCKHDCGFRRKKRWLVSRHENTCELRPIQMKRLSEETTWLDIVAPHAIRQSFIQIFSNSFKYFQSFED